MTRDKMIDELAAYDINSIRASLEQGDTEFLNSVLRGDGWSQYNSLTDVQISVEYNEMVGNQTLV